MNSPNSIPSLEIECEEAIVHPAWHPPSADPKIILQGKAPGSFLIQFKGLTYKNSNQYLVSYFINLVSSNHAIESKLIKYGHSHIHLVWLDHGLENSTLNKVVERYANVLQVPISCVDKDRKEALENSFAMKRNLLNRELASGFREVLGQRNLSLASKFHGGLLTLELMKDFMIKQGCQLIPGHWNPAQFFDTSSPFYRRLWCFLKEVLS